MKDAASPVSAFVRERCDVAVTYSVAVDELWRAWRAWCEDNGHRAGTKQTLTRDLRAVVPGARTYRPHGQARRYASIRLHPSDGIQGNNGEPSGSSGSAGSERGQTTSGDPLEPLEPLADPLSAQHPLGTCCGERGTTGAPLTPACQLCPDSASYYRGQ